MKKLQAKNRKNTQKEKKTERKKETFGTSAVKPDGLRVLCGRGYSWTDLTNPLVFVNVNNLSFFSKRHLLARRQNIQTEPCFIKKKDVLATTSNNLKFKPFLICVIYRAL